MDNQVMSMKTRKLSVYQDFYSKPYIVLKGKWFQELGFKYHDKVQISTYKDKVIIERIKDPNLNKKI